MNAHYWTVRFMCRRLPHSVSNEFTCKMQIILIVFKPAKFILNTKWTSGCGFWSKNRIFVNQNWNYSNNSTKFKLTQCEYCRLSLTVINQHFGLITSSKIAEGILLFSFFFSSIFQSYQFIKCFIAQRCIRNRPSARALLPVPVCLHL